MTHTTSNGSGPGIGGKPGHGHPPNITVPGIDTALQPQDLVPPPITVLQNNPGTAPGDVFAGPKIVVPGTPGQQGPEIVDNEGRPVWFQPIDLPYQATDFRVQHYQGKPVLTCQRRPEHRRPRPQRRARTRSPTSTTR